MGEYLARLARLRPGRSGGKVERWSGGAVERRWSTIPGDGLCLCWIMGGRACTFLASGRCVAGQYFQLCEYHEWEAGGLTMHCVKDAVEEILL